MRERQQLEERITGIRDLESRLEDNIGLVELGEEEDDAEVVKEAEDALRTMRQDIDRRQIELLLSGEADANDTYIEIHSGAGGTESQDWANMLMRMYTRWAERHGMKVEVLEVHYGEEAGIKSVTVLV